MTERKPRDDPDNPYEPGGPRPGSGGDNRDPNVRSLFGTDKAPINEEGQKWRAQNLKSVEEWAKEKNALTKALDNLLAMNGSPAAQRSLVEFLVGRPVSQSEIMRHNTEHGDDSAAAMNDLINAMKKGMVDNGVDPAFADRIVETSLWGDGHEAAEEGDEEVFEAGP